MMRHPGAGLARQRPRAGPFATLVALMALVIGAALPLSARADPLPEPSPDIVAQILAARDGAAPGDGAARLLALRAALPPADARTPQQAVDHAMLSLYGAALSAAAGAAPQALSLFDAAAAELAALGPGAAPAQAAAIENAAALVARRDGPEAGRARYVAARAVRARHALPVDASTIAALEQAGRLAQATGDAAAMIEELRAIRDATARIAPDAGIIRARAGAHSALLATTLGLHGMALRDAGAAAIAADAAMFALETRAPGTDAAADCTALAPALRDLLALFAEIGAHAEGARLITFQIARLHDTCAGRFDPPHALRVDMLAARLYLGAGDPLAAHLRLRAAAATLAADGGDDADSALSADVIRLRQAGARLALGFPGEAEALLDQVPPGLGQPETHVHQRERLVVLARLQAARHRPAEAARTLARAEALQTAAAPLHWAARMTIAHHRALLLLEAGDAEGAAAARTAFDADIAARRAEARAISRALGPAGAPGLPGFLSGIMGADAARPNDTDDPVIDTALGRLRMLQDLAVAADSGDAAAARAAFDAVPGRGLPRDSALAGLAQAAYLRACYAAYGPGLRCDTAAAAAVDAPLAVPHACAGGCAWVMPGAPGLAFAAGMLRRGPLLDSFAEPVLRAQIAAADAAVAGLPGGGGALQRGTLRAMGRLAGAGAAFALAQRRLEGSAARAVSQVGARLAAGNDAVARVMRARDALGERLDALLRDTAATPDAIAALSEAVQANRAELEALRPDYAALFDPAPLSPEEIDALLPRGAAFVMISSTEAATYVFAVRDGTLGWWRAPIGRAALEADVAQLRAALDPLGPDRGAQSLLGAGRAARDFDRARAHRLHQALFAPLDDMLAGADLHVVADGPLAALPLSVLVVSAPSGDDADPDALRATDWFFRHHAVTMHAAPTGLRLAALHRKRPRAPQAFAGFGDPVFAPRDAPGAAFARLAPLPGTRTEIDRLAALFKAPRDAVRLGPDASKDAVLAADLGEARVLAFATHGLLAGQIAGLDEPGLVFSAAPGRNPEDPAASYLAASEAAMLDLNADWVLLSACDTAGPDGQPDSQGLSGLARAFLFAGARSVLVSHWPVRDDAAMLLTTTALHWQAANPKAPRARAMQAAMLKVMNHRATPALAHPSAWAPFVLLGDG